MFQQLPGAVLYGRPLQDGLAQEIDVYRALPANVPERPAYEGQLDFAGVENHYFLAAALPGPRPGRVDYRPISLPGLDHDLVEFEIAVEPGGVELPFFIGPKDFDLLAAVHPDLVRAHRLRLPVGHRRPPPPDPEVDPRVRRQLRVVDHPAHGAHQHRDLPAAPQERRLDAEDAGAAAGDEGDPGALRRPEGDGSGPAEDEPGG